MLLSSATINFPFLIPFWDGFIGGAVKEKECLKKYTQSSPYVITVKSDFGNKRQNFKNLLQIQNLILIFEVQIKSILSSSETKFYSIKKLSYVGIIGEALKIGNFCNLQLLKTMQLKNILSLSFEKAK